MEVPLSELKLPSATFAPQVWLSILDITQGLQIS